jgi:hypothetical protein
VSRRDEERRAWLYATFGVETWGDVALIGVVVTATGALTALSLFYW